MKKTFEEITDLQIMCAIRVEQEKAAKKTTKLGEAMKVMIGNPNDRIRGKLTYLAELLEEKRETARRNNCSTDKDKNIMRDKDSRYMYTAEGDEKCSLAFKNIMKETVNLDVEKDCVFVTELPANLTEGEIYHCLGILFSQETLDAWKNEQEKIEDDKQAADRTPQAEAAQA